MNLLIIDSSTEISSAALLSDGKISSIIDIGKHKASENLLLNINKLLAEANLKVQDLSAIGFSRGPGSFTGVRIAASIAQGLALGADLPIITVTSLDLLAEQARQMFGASQVLTSLDARKNEVYTGYFELDPNTGCMSLIQNITLKSSSVINKEKQIFLAGNGFILDSRLRGNDEYINIPEILDPDAKFGLDLVKMKYQNKDFVSLERAVPLYIRNKVVG